MFRKSLSIILSVFILFGSLSAAAVSASAVDTAITDTGADYGLASSCEGGNILQCFNWTLAQIKAELPNIAQAGFTSVQTSPLQAHDGRNQWYWLYQPTGFTIGNELGSYDDLKALCTEADKYGIKIIVDAVANHVAGSDTGNLANSVESVFKTNKSTYLHNLGKLNNETSRYDITHKNIGMPDLNSENTAIQNMAFAMIEKYKAAGVDGIRWDAAKHIGLPSENCAFWSKMAQIDLYQYGEILNNPGGDDSGADNEALMKEYAQYLHVTDSGYSTTFMNTVNSGNIYRTDGNWTKKGIGADRVVYWAESHDTFANTNGNTKNIDQNMIDKAYAILGARANSQAMYLSRPSETVNDRIYYAKKGSTHFTSKEVAAVNHFHNAMAGTAEKYNSVSGCYVVYRGGGAVLVSMKSADVDVSVKNYQKMVPTGTYTDEVSGNSFTVTDSKITGHIGSSGIAVIYNAPAAHTHTPGTPVQENLIAADCTTQGSYDEVVYCTECGEEISRTAKTIPPAKHITETISGTPATYFHTGITDGEKCTNCNKWITEQQVIPVLKGEGIFCDVNNDGEITLNDATFIQRKTASITLPFSMDEMKGDADDDGILSVTDVTLIQLWLTGMKPNEHIGAKLG